MARHRGAPTVRDRQGPRVERGGTPKAPLPNPQRIVHRPALANNTTMRHAALGALYQRVRGDRRYRCIGTRENFNRRRTDSVDRFFCGGFTTEHNRRMCQRGRITPGAIPRGVNALFCMQCGDPHYVAAGCGEKPTPDLLVRFAPRVVSDMWCRMRRSVGGLVYFAPVGSGGVGIGGWRGENATAGRYAV